MLQAISTLSLSPDTCKYGMELLLETLNRLSIGSDWCLLGPDLSDNIMLHGESREWRASRRVKTTVGSGTGEGFLEVGMFEGRGHPIHFALWIPSAEAAVLHSATETPTSWAIETASVVDRPKYPATE